MDERAGKKAGIFFHLEKATPEKGKNTWTDYKKWNKTFLKY
jgi:hypothetical protein